MRDWSADVWRRMNELADSLGVPDNEYRWPFLAYELARRHEPSLMEASAMGSFKVWTDATLRLLAADVDSLISAGHDLRSALERIAQKRPSKPVRTTKAGLEAATWADACRSLDASSDAAAALRRRYREAQKLPALQRTPVHSPGRKKVGL